MARDKRERHRLKRDRKRQGRIRRETQVLQVVARQERAFDVACRAESLLRNARLAEAAAAARHAAALAPRDRAMAVLYVTAAERLGDPHHQRRAYEHLSGLVEPEATLLLCLADIYLQAGEHERATEVALRARACFPGRMKDRRRWRDLLDYVEARCAEHRAAGRPPTRRSPDTLPLFPPQHGADNEPAAPAQATAERTAPPANDAGRAAVPQPAEASTLDISVSISAEITGLGTLGTNGSSTPRDVHLGVLAARIREATSFDHLLALEHCNGLLRLSHQEETARKVLSVFLGRALLADEVGLGKTVEAGLILSEYRLRGRVERALILVPPSLLGQWREELEVKFGISTRTTDDGTFRDDPDFWSASGVVVASLATARSSRHRDAVIAEPWDMVIVDEAHWLKNARTLSYTLVARLTSRFFLLLTATPIESKVEELYNLVSLIRPGLLGGRTDFVRRLGGGRGRISETARREVRTLLGEVMIRNTRALSGVRLPPRYARTVLVQPHPSEGQLYEHLVTALRALGARGRTRLLLSILLQEAGSSPAAVKRTLEKIRDTAELPDAAREALGPTIAYAERMTDTGKGAALVRALAGGDEATVVFTRFRATLDFLAGLLAASGVPYERIDGDRPARMRHEAIARCRETRSVLLSTDVGSEGLNLQFCRRIVNFDLPWNPMRIEQRVGRVHRIGQDHPVDVVNLCLAGSIEERVLRILDERINLFELVIGEVEMILGYLEEEGDFSTLVFDAFATADADRREQRFARIGDALAAARDRYQDVKVFDEEFFRNELGV